MPRLTGSRLAVFALFSLAAFAVQASGAIIIATDGQTGPGPFTPTYTVSNTDLINGASPSAQTGNFGEETSGGVGVLTNGTFGTISGGNPGNNTLFATAGTGEQVTYALNLAASPQGYNLSRIDVYGGWNDSGRDQQLYTVAYSTVANPSAFVDLTSVNFNPTAGGDPSATRVSITENALANLASNVAAVRFTFDQPAAPENGYTGYTEIDVIGTPVPEPTSLAALAVVALAALHRRRSRA
jgi:hypothetical protein